MKYLDYTFVVDNNSVPCTPVTNNEAGYLMRCGLAKVINHDPFVIQRLDDYISESEIRDEITMKMDMGYMNIGFLLEQKTMNIYQDRLKCLMEYRKDLNKEQVTDENEEVESDTEKIRMWIIRLHTILHIKMEMRTIGLHHQFSIR